MGRTDIDFFLVSSQNGQDCRISHFGNPHCVDVRVREQDTPYAGF